MPDISSWASPDGHKLETRGNITEKNIMIEFKPDAL